MSHRHVDADLDTMSRKNKQRSTIQHAMLRSVDCNIYGKNPDAQREPVRFLSLRGSLPRFFSEGHEGTGDADERGDMGRGDSATGLRGGRALSRSVDELFPTAT